MHAACVCVYTLYIYALCCCFTLAEHIFAHTHTHVEGVCVRVFALLQALAKCALCWRHCQHAEDIFAFFGSVSATWLGRAPEQKQSKKQRRTSGRAQDTCTPRSLSLSVSSLILQLKLLKYRPLKTVESCTHKSHNWPGDNVAYALL